MAKKTFLILLGCSMMLLGCQKEDTDQVGAQMTFKFAFDANQARLDNFGQPAQLPEGHAGQTPEFNQIAAHYVEIIPSALTQLGDGAILYKGPETTAGGATAIDFANEKKVTAGEEYLKVALADIPPGTYEYIRVSLAYQNYDIRFKFEELDLSARLASFVGYNSYIQDYEIKDSTVSVSANKAQGYFGFETIYSVVTGDAPTTTVPNPIAATSPIPLNSCVVTGQFDPPLIITDGQSSDINITLSLSINKSFEWKEVNEDGLWEPTAGEEVVDMGIRGLQPIVQ